MAPKDDSSFTDIPPFFTPGAPPPTLPIPIAQTEIGRILSPGRLLAEEQIGPKSKAHRNIGARFSPYQKAKVTRFERQRSRTPYAATSCAADASDAESKGSSDDSSSDDDDNDSEKELIPKPEGDAGRPGRGGYNLEDKLGWPRKEFQQMKQYVKELISERLNPTQSYASQRLASVIEVRNLAAERFPILRDYAKSWPATDLIRLQLKYTSGRARLEESKFDAQARKRLRRSSPN